MRILVVGAGALGGYYGGRLLEAGQDVTFLLRERRMAQLRQTGLVIRSPLGDAVLPAPPSVLSADIAGAYDVVLVGCKAYDLAATMESFAAAVGPDTMVVPLLNGMRHLEQLEARSGAERVVGGYCLISASLSAEGVVQHHNDSHGLHFGERDGHLSERVLALQAACAGAKMQGKATATILQEMWEKWTFIASAAGITCLMRAAIGDIAAAGGADTATGMFAECCAIAARNGHGPREDAAERSRRMLTNPKSAMTASMLKDIERGGPVEADQIIGDMLRRAGEGEGEGEGAGAVPAPLLRMAHVHLQAYEARRAREAAATQ